MPPLDQRSVYRLIESFAGQANILTIPRLFIDWTGDHISALLLSQIIYWSSRTKDEEGWFYKSAKDWEAELGISDYQLARASKKLTEAGISTKLKKIQGAPTLHYRIDEAVFLEWISEKLGNGFPIPSEVDMPVSGNSSHTETTNRDSDRDRFEASIGLVNKYDDDRDVLLNYIADFAREFADQAPLASSVSRAQNLYRQSGLSLDDFIARLYAARAITKERSGAVRGAADDHGRKQKMAYFFSCLERQLTQESA